jgi:RNase P subunit RPR2
MQPRRAHKRRSEKELSAVRAEVATLFAEAKAYFEKGDKKLATRRVRAARRRAMKVQMPIPEYALRYCRSCEGYLKQGVNCTIRIRNSIRILRCLECGAVRRKVLR